MTTTETAEISAQEVEQRSALAASFRPPAGPAKPTCAASFSLPQPELLQALSTVMKSIPTRRGYPDILFHVQVQAESDHVTLSGTNLATGIVLRVDAQVEQTGIFTINARTLLDCVKSFPKAGSVTLEVKDGRVNVTSGKRNFSLKDTTDAAEFPKFPDSMMARPCVIAADTLRQAVKEVQYAAAIDDSRPIYLAVCMHVLPDSMNLVAMDNKRMAIRTLALPSVSGRDQVVMVEADVWRLLCDVMPKGSTVSIAWDKERASWSVGNLRLVARLISGTYPDYTVPLPTSHKTTFTLGRNTLVSLLNAFRPFTRDSSDILQLFYAPSGLVTFKACSDDLWGSERRVGD